MAVSCLLPAAALADTLIGDAADASALENGTTARTDLKKLYVGGGDGTYDYSAVFVFQLPDLGAVADPFITSSFSFNYNTRQGSGFPDVDLYGLGRRDTATVLSSDYYGETTVVDPTDATFLQSNILTSAVTSGNLVTTDSDGNAALIGYLNAQYDGGNGIGKYVFLRLSSNSPASVTSRYEVNASEAVVNSLPQPTIEYTAAGPPVDTIRAETQPDGSGVVAPPTALIQGSSLTAYAIARDSSMAYLSNTSATWSLVNITGSIVAGDLVAAADGKSATFTASGAGTAEIRAVNNSTNVVNSGTITVTPLTPPYGYQPNIVIVLADDLTWRHAGPYTEMPGGPTTIPANLTPNMDALAAEGMTFNYAFTAATTCSPCRHALYSGIHPVRNGGYPNHARHKTGTDTIVTHLQALGYQVRRNGKDHVDPASSYPWNSQANNPTPNTGDINLINGSDPFCLIVASHHPHQPWQAGTNPYATQAEIDNITFPADMANTAVTREMYNKYLAEVGQLDHNLGLFKDEIENAGKTGNTIFMFLSEQGAAFPGGKWTCYDMGMRAAVIVKWPGVVPANTRTDAMIDYIDIMPTLIEAAGGVLPAGPKRLDGLSLLDVLANGKPQHREYVYSIYSSKNVAYTPSGGYTIRAIRSKDYKLIWNLQHTKTFTNATTSNTSADQYAVWDSWVTAATGGDTDAAFLTNRYQNRPEYEFFDLQADPYELNNAVSDPQHADRIAGMKVLLEQWMANQGEQFVDDPAHKRYSAGSSVKDQGIWTEQNYDKNLNIAEIEPYEAWANAYGLTGTDRDKTADIDGDGLNQYEEWTFGRNPNQPDVNPVHFEAPIAQHIEDGYVHLIFDRLMGYQNYHFNYTVETSEDMLTWQPASSTVQPWPVFQGDGLVETVTVRVPETLAPRKFYRLRVTEN